MGVNPISYSEAIRQALGEEMESDPSVFLMGEDIGAYGGAFGVTRGLLDRFGPDRVIDTPISEGSFVGAAVGAALAGSRPVVEIMFMDFITLAADPLINMAAKLHYVFGEGVRCPLVLRTPAGGGRCYGPTHSQSLEALFTHVPGLKVVAPATAADARWMMRAAIRDDNPVVFVEHKLLYRQAGVVPGRPPPGGELGRARVARAGKDVTVVAWSYMTIEAERAAVELAAHGIDVEVLDLRSLYPLDAAALAESARKTRRVVIVEEGCRTGGLAAEIGFQVFEQAYDYLDAPIRRVAGLDVPVPASPGLERAVIPDAGRIVQAVRDLMGR